MPSSRGEFWKTNHGMTMSTAGSAMSAVDALLVVLARGRAGHVDRVLHQVVGG